MFRLRLSLPIALQTALSAILCFVPLFDLLGYEYSFAVGLLGVPTAFFIGLQLGRRHRSGPRAASKACAWATLWAVLHLLPGLLLISLNALRVRNCDFGEGLIFFLLLPLPSVLYSSLLGVFMSRLQPTQHRLKTLVFSLMLLLLPIIAALLQLYWHPPIFHYDHLWGYFSGSLYDEGIEPQRTLFAFRTITLFRCGLLLILLMLMQRLGGPRPPRTMRAASLVVFVLLVSSADRLAGTRLGYRIERDDILRALPVTIRRPNLVLHLPADTPEALQNAVALDHGFRLAQLSRALDVQPDRAIHSFVFRNATHKARLMGGRATMVAKPWLREVHIHGLHREHAVLAHELTHALAAEFGDPIFGASARGGFLINMGLVEGLAEAMSPRQGSFDLHSNAKAMRDMNMAPDIRSILGAQGFWKQAPRRAYAVAGSFVKFLLDTYGIQAFKKLYANADFVAAYQKNLNRLVLEWETMVENIEVLPRDRRQARRNFQQRSIFKRPCAHVIAKLRARARKATPDEAIPIHEEIAEHLGHTLSVRIDLANAYRRAQKQNEFLERTEKLLQEKGISSSQRAELVAARGEVQWNQGNLDLARASFEEALTLRTSLGFERLQWVRLWALDTDEEIQELLRQYLNHRSKKALAKLIPRATPDNKTLNYLLGRYHYNTGKKDQALRFLKMAEGHSFLPLEAERTRLVADLHYRAQRWEQAQQSYAMVASIGPTSGERALATDFLARIDYNRALEAQP